VPDGLLAGRRALVTGAARGIGLAVARRYCEEGAAVALSDLGDVEGPVAELAAQGHTAIAVPFEVADEAAVDAGVAEARDRLGGLDVCVANAGIVRFVPALDTSLELWRQTLDVNLTGAFLCLRAAGRIFREQGHGVLLATSSQAGLHGYRGEAAYCASKFGVVGLVEVMAKELAPHGVRVNCVAPGTVDTPMQELVVEEFARRAGGDLEAGRRALIDTIPFGRGGTPTEIADAFVYLASDLAGYVSGATLVVDGAECS
jgi:NAD(P)-dependent dehydrogenase (short-subunit alcohol dehydrogenase family)